MNATRWCVLLALLLGPVSMAAAAEPLTFMVRGPEPAQNDAFARAMEAHAQGELRSVPEHGSVIVALGGGAFMRTLSHPAHPPVLGVAVNRALAERWVAPGCRCSAVWRGVPLDIQLRLLRAIMPQARRVGILMGPHSAWGPPEPHMEGLALQAVWVDDPNRLGQQLRRRLPDWDALVLPADETLFNAGAAKLILLTSYRQRVPVFGPDAGYVRAGSVASAYADADDMARAAAERLLRWGRQGPLPAGGFAGHYSVTVNPHVAGAYDLILRDPDDLEQTLESRP